MGTGGGAVGSPNTGGASQGSGGGQAELSHAELLEGLREAAQVSTVVDCRRMLSCCEAWILLELGYETEEDCAGNLAEVVGLYERMITSVEGGYRKFHPEAAAACQASGERDICGSASDCNMHSFLEPLVPLGAACLGTNDCIQDAHCNEQFVCAPRKPDGEPCSNHRECEGNWCAEPVPPDTESTCQTLDIDLSSCGQ